MNYGGSIKMKTNNEAQQKEDVMMDLYKIHAYIPNDAVNNPLTPFGNFCRGYKAAKSECEKEITSLRAQVIKLQDLYGTSRVERGRLISEIGNIEPIKITPTWDNNVYELRAENQRLREAISCGLDCIREEINPNNYTNDTLGDFISDYGDMVTILQQALATPAQSLAEHDAEVIERCAKVVEKYVNLKLIAEEIREMKGK